MAIKLGDYEVRFARSLQERSQVRALRYKCFIEEDGASATEEQRKLREEWDAWDVFAKYLTVFHKDKVVGVYQTAKRPKKWVVFIQNQNSIFLK